MDVTEIKPVWVPSCIGLVLALAISQPTPAAAEEVRLEAGEHTVSANVSYAGEKNLSGTVVLMLHGTLGHKDMEIMATLQSVFQESTYNSVAINLSLNVDNRHGFYDCDVPHTHRAEDAFAELALWMRWLDEQGADKVILLGHSRGANQIARYAASKTGSEYISNAAEMYSDPILIGGVVLLAPSTGADAAAADARLIQASRENTDGWLPEKIDFLHCQDTQVSSASYLSYLGPDADADTVPVIARLQVPTLVIAGTEDTVVPELPERMAQIDNAAVSYTEIDDADHFFRDLYAYDVVDAITAFIERQESEIENVDEHLIPLATSLQADGELSAENHKPILVMISQQGCQFCHLLRKQVLFPMMRAGRLADRLIVREVRLDTGFSLTDFSGQEVAGLEFARRYGAYITPTLLFLDSEGQQLADPIVGTGNIEYYGFYLERAIAAAAGRLTRNNGPN